MKNILKKIFSFNSTNSQGIHSTSLHSLFESSNLKLVDIGSGNRIGPGIGNFVQFANYINYFPCDPSMNSTTAPEIKWKSITFIREAIWTESGTKLLNIMSQPGLSSLLKPKDSVVNQFNNHADYKINNTQTVKTITLTEASQKYNFENVGFLSIDTQGSELDILISGETLLQNSISGIYIETEFQELYEGQSFFADIDIYLRKLRFVLFDIDRVLMRRQNYTRKQYSRKQISHSHCLYIKPPESINAQDNETLKSQYEQLLVIAIINEHYDLAREICSVEPSRYLLFEEHGISLLDDLERFIDSKTQRIKHITRKNNPESELSNPLYKDRKHRYK